MTEVSKEQRTRILRIQESPRSAMPNQASLLDLDREQLAAFLSDEPRFRTDQVWTAVHRQSQLPAEMTTVPLALRSRLAEEFPPALSLVTRQDSRDQRTTKALFALNGGAQVETVLMRYDERATV